MLMPILTKKSAENPPKKLSFEAPQLAKKITIFPSHSKTPAFTISQISLHNKNLPHINKTSQNFSLLNKTCISKPQVTAKAWAIYDINSETFVDSYKDSDKREIASLTKIMTCIVAIEELMENKRSFDEIVEVSVSAASISGTKAGLSAKDNLKIIDLLYALMLPSGNDAALALAEAIGSSCFGKEVEYFVHCMNIMGQRLGLRNTRFCNPHGMSTSKNMSTAADLACLAAYAMKNRLFKKIVSSLSYSCGVLNGTFYRRIDWMNTNRLLTQGFSGIKTGFTPAAGPCLCCSISEGNCSVVIVILKSRYRHLRWSEALKLWSWAISSGNM